MRKLKNKAAVKHQCNTPFGAQTECDQKIPGLRSNYELFNCSNFNIRYWSWNYRGCWPCFYQRKVYIYFLSLPLELTNCSAHSRGILTEGLVRSLSFITE